MQPNLKVADNIKRQRNAQLYTWLALILLLIGFALRLHKLTAVPLSRDELRTILLFVRLPLPEIFVEFNSNNHPLAAALAHLLSPQGDHLFMLRWSAALVGMLSLPLIYRLGAAWFDRRVGLLALLLFGFSYVHLSYSIFVRGYIGLVTLTLVSAFFLWRGLRANRWRDWLAFAAANVAIILFHLFGALAAWAQIGLAALWLVYTQVNQRNQTRQLLRFAVAVALIAAFHLPFVYLRTSSILDEGGYAADFDVWNNGQFTLAEEFAPLRHFITLMGPMSPGGVGTWLYFIFFGIGLVTLWRREAIFGLLAALWFAGPFLGVWLGMWLVGDSFYVYTRFLLYLMPSYLLLTASGLVAAGDWMWQWGNRAQLRPKRLARLAIWGGLAVLLVMQLVSLWWYKQTSLNTDWQAVAATIAAQKRPEDIVICDEDQGFDVPDRAKAYCVWMMDMLIPGLEEYTYPLQSSTSIVADYDYLRAHQAAMLGPGGVWLVIWRRQVIIYPDYFDATRPPPISEWPPADLFAPYQSWPAGAAMLVYVNSAATLFGNVYQAVELLSKIEDSAPDQARYYRSLAEMNAFRGDAKSAWRFFEQSRQQVEQAGGQYPDLFLLETRPVIERIPLSGSAPPGAIAANLSVAPNLCLAAYTISSPQLQAGQPLELTYYWRADGVITQDYKLYLQLQDPTGQSWGRYEFDPFDRVYPTPWWWPGQQLEEPRDFAIPPELPAQDYTVSLGAFDRVAAGQEVASPLFHLRPGPDSTWRIEPVASPNSSCEPEN